jgi:hypothetical protein
MFPSPYSRRPGMSTAGGTFIGPVTNTGQPAFSAELVDGLSNVTGDGTLYTLVFASGNDVERFDQGNDFVMATGIFTAPVIGRYAFSGAAHVGGMTASTTFILIRLATSNLIYTFTYIPTAGDTLGMSLAFPFSVLADMDSGDTAKITIDVRGTGKVVDIDSTSTAFQGRLVA